MIGWLFRKLLGIPDAPTRSAPDTPGGQTSEGKLAILNTVIASVLAVLAMFLPDLPREELREVLLWVAGLILAGSSGTYSLARARVKAELAKGFQELERERLWAEAEASLNHEMEPTSGGP